MSIRRPVALTANYGDITQGFEGNFSWEPAGYLRTDVFPHRGARYKWWPTAASRACIHLAQDYAVPTGTPVVAVETGKIIRQGMDSSGAYYIYQQVRVGSVYKVIALYYHLKAASFRYKVGDTVLKGATIALSGATGKVTGPHLHFELWRVPRLLAVYLWYHTAIRFDPAPLISGVSSLSQIAP